LISKHVCFEKDVIVLQVIVGLHEKCHHATTIGAGRWICADS
jgi:hypothetical protein